MKRTLSFLLFISFLFTIPDSISAKGKKIPYVGLESETLFFSPNQDGIQEKVDIQLRIENIRALSAWELQFHDSLGILRKTMKGGNNLPSSVSWKGDDSLPEGTYTVSFTIVTEKMELIHASPLKVVMDLSPPAISLVSISTNIFVEDHETPPIEFNFSAVDLSGISQWEIHIRDDKRETLFTEKSTGALPSTWMLSSEKVAIPTGTISAVLTVTDRAGNQSRSSPAQIAVQTQKEVIVEAKPVKKIKRNPKKTSGKTIQLTSIISISDLFGKNADRGSSLLPQSQFVLDPLAEALLNAPGAKVMILGHVDQQTNRKNEKDLSSYFAWKTYSYFVKQKGVDRETIFVKGFGATVPVANNKNPLEKKRNRRIEIQILLPVE